MPNNIRKNKEVRNQLKAEKQQVREEQKALRLKDKEQKQEQKLALKEKLNAMTKAERTAYKKQLKLQKKQLNKKPLTDKQIMKLLQRSTHQNKQAYPFLYAWLIGFVVMTIIPFFYTMYLSFNDVQLTGLGWELTWIGFENYITAFFGNISFTPALIEFITLEFTYVPAIVIFSFILGILLNRDIKFRSGFRTIFFLPVIVLSGSVMDQLMNSGSTSLADFSENIIFKMLLNYSPFMARTMLGLFTNFTMVLWFTGIPIILFINGLQKISRSLYEAAKIDGATSWQILWKITIPIIKPTALIVTIFTIVQIGMYNINPIFGLIRDSMYNFQGGLGLASSYAFVYTLVVLLFVGIAMIVLRTKSDNVDVKLSSIQKKRFEMMTEYRKEKQLLAIENKKEAKLEVKRQKEEKVKQRETEREKYNALSAEDKAIIKAKRDEEQRVQKEEQTALKEANKIEKQKEKEAKRIAKQDAKEIRHLEKEKQREEKRQLAQAKKEEKERLREVKAQMSDADKQAQKLEMQKQQEIRKAEKTAQRQTNRDLKIQEREENRRIFKMRVKRIFTSKKYFAQFLTTVIIYILLITISYVFLFPFISMLSLALMSPQDIINVEVDFIPRGLYFGNFIVAMEALNGYKALFNSIWFSGTLAVAQTIISALTGFAFARYDFRFKKVLFALILVSFIVPVPIIFIPRLMMFISAQSSTGIKLIGTVIPQLSLALFGQGVNSAILILIFYNFFRLIPNVLYEAARIDGASPFKQFWEITIKMSLSTIVVVFLFSFVWNWNETYVTNQLLGDNMELLPLQLGIFDTLFANRPSSNVPGQEGVARISEAYRMAATFISMLPLFILYFLAQKQFVEGIEKTGITGE